MLLNLEILVAIHCHEKQLLLCFEKHNRLCVSRLFSDARLHYPVFTTVTETNHIEIDVEAT